VLSDAARAATHTRVFILGDLFDVWVNSGQMRVSPWDRVVDALRGIVDQGVSCTVLHGNRDFMLDARFAARTGCRVAPGGIAFRLADRPALALHGDELCQRDVDYQRAKRYLRHPLTRGLLRCLPTRVALSLGDRARRRSRAVIARQPDQSRFEPTRGAVEAAFATGASLLVFGHIHRWARGSFVAADGRECEYCVLPAFDESGVHLRHEHGSLRFCAADGSTVPDPPARSFD
jgi:UDP-2,3-diacylglucosamine hydrolase